MRIKKTSQYIEGGAGLPSYFTDEIDTGMKWIDGKPIYRKVISTGNISESSTVYFDTSILNLNQVIDIKAIGTDGGTSRPIPNTTPNNTDFNVSIFYHHSQNRVYIQTPSSVSFTNVDITLEYTKTTD